jgi:hypothetical protein
MSSAYAIALHLACVLRRPWKLKAAWFHLAGIGREIRRQKLPDRKNKQDREFPD